MYLGKKYSFRRTKFVQPHQTSPNKQIWALWRKALRKAFPMIDHKLIYCLGRQTLNDREDWNQFLCRVSKQLYFKISQEEWKVYKRVNHHGLVRQGNQFWFLRRSNFTPSTLERATVTHISYNLLRVQLTGWYKDLAPIPKNPEQWKVWIIDKSEGDEELLVERIAQADKVLIVSNGSFHPIFKKGTALQIIATLNTLQNPIYSNNIIPGTAKVQCSHRSELSRIIRAVHHLSSIC